ncbi:MAG: hypothetical protein QOG46_1046 [Pseudonocardiales bacterium]|nr:hypothetical protein [Pseudonocardiales bacterium]
MSSSRLCGGRRVDRDHGDHRASEEGRTGDDQADPQPGNERPAAGDQGAQQGHPDAQATSRTLT